MGAKTVARLEELLDAKDERISELESELEKYHDAEESEAWRWAVHVELPKEQTLPVPRMEIVCEQAGGDWFSRIWRYRIVYRHLLGHCVAVPMGTTRVSGGAQRKPDLLRHAWYELPFRDGAHIRHDARQFGLPVFAICEDVCVPLDLEERA